MVVSILFTTFANESDLVRYKQTKLVKYKERKVESYKKAVV